jgi:hypothetical protein
VGKGVCSHGVFVLYVCVCVGVVWGRGVDILPSVSHLLPTVKASNAWFQSSPYRISKRISAPNHVVLPSVGSGITWYRVRHGSRILEI